MKLDYTFSIADIANLIIAGIALWVAWVTLRKTTQHDLKIARSESHFAKSIERPNGFHELEIYFKNLGLPLPEMSVALGFCELDGFGWSSAPLRAVNIVTNKSSHSASDVATGMVVKFGWRTYEMTEFDITFLRTLEDLRKQKAVLSVYCAGYHVKSIRLGSLSDRIARRYHGMIFTVLQQFKLGHFAKNQKSWRARVRHPDSHDLSFSLAYFLSALKKEMPQQGGHGAERNV